MSKKTISTIGKVLALSAVVAAAAGAIYYYKQKTKNAVDDDDFDNFEDEGDDELEDYLNKEIVQSVQTEKSLKDIFPINLSSDTAAEAKATLKKAVMDIGDKVVDMAETVSGVVKQSENAPVEDFKFYDLSEVDDEVVPQEPEVELVSTAAAIPTPAAVTDDSAITAEAAEKADEEFFTEDDIVEEEKTDSKADAADDEDIWSDSI